MSTAVLASRNERSLSVPSQKSRTYRENKEESAFSDSYNELAGLSSFPSTIDAEPQFKRLSEAWRRKKVPMSSVEEIVLIPEYLKILTLGNAAIRLILRDLERSPDHWFTALEILTGENPVPERERGNMKRMSMAWIEWGKLNKYLG